MTCRAHTYEKYFILCVLIVGFALRLGFILVSQNYVKPHAWEYGEIAQNIVAGDGYVRVNEFSGTREATSSHAPLYPFFLAFFYGFGQTTAAFLILLLVQAAVGSITILLLYKIAHRIFNKSTARLTACGVALYPPLIYYCGKLVPTTLLIFLLSITFLLMYKQRIAAGFTLGLAMLCNPVSCMLFPAALLWSLIQKKRSLRNLLFVLIIAFITVLPWTIRNYVVHKRCVPITTQFAINFWIGNNPNASGTDYIKVNTGEQNEAVLMTETLDQQTRTELAVKSEVRRADFFLTEACSFSVQHAQAFVGLLVKKLSYYWWFPPAGLSGSADLTQNRLLYSIVYLPVLVLAVVEVICALTRPRTRQALLIILFVCFFSNVYVISHVGLMRYRVPLEPLLIMLSACAITACLFQDKRAIT